MEWKAFELKPGTPPEGIPRPFKDGANSELTGPMKAAADAVGLWNMRRQPFVPSSRLAMQGALYAKSQNAFEAYHKATFKAFWEESKNIGDDQILQEIFEQSQLDWTEFYSPKNLTIFSQQMGIQLREPHLYGISAVPAFILDRYLIMGAQPYEVFQQVMNRLHQENVAPR